MYFNRVGVRPFLSLEVAEHAALGCWFVVTLCVAVLLKSICSERYLVELVIGAYYENTFEVLVILRSPLTNETGYCRARWVSVVRSPLRAARWPDVVLRAATPRVCSNRPRNAVVVSVVAVSAALMDIIW